MDTQPLIYKHLGWKTYWIFVSERARIAIAIGLIAVVFTFFPQTKIVSGATHIILLVFAAAVLVTLLVSAVEYRRWEYLLDEDALRIRRGILHREEIAIPYRQVENANIERNIINQLTGTCSLVILTAGHTDEEKEAVARANTEGVIPVLDHKLAQSLQQELISRANIQKVVNTQ